MSWLSNLTPPGIKNMFKREDDSGSDSLWHKCKNCGEMIFHRDLESNQRVCPSCGHHMSFSVTERFSALFDHGKFETIDLPETPVDPLKFKDERRYTDRLKDAKRKTGAEDAMSVAVGCVDGSQTVAACQNFAFMGGSMGAALGEAFLKAVEEACRRRIGLVVFTASGGARMQEGILSLMQMPRTTIGIQMLREAGLPFIVVLTHPTTGGVTASYAMLGDVHIAEPGALIGFAGPRVIEQTIREKLPEGFQRSEFLQEKGMVDLVVHRHELPKTIAQLIRVLTKDGLAHDNASGTDQDAAAATAEAVGAPANDAPVAIDKAAE
ncbi:MAG: acetyl-CoA carboxylase carboxyltransferase subunit beta [Parvularculaceae bacterium]|nr:MAG: acetyl-CoA carboxylase carboxyltransferase subunit beta [Parvularculaceae bacterium]